MRAALAQESMDARKEGRPRSLGKLSNQGITPGAVEKVIPATREGHQAYLNGFEDAFIRHPGRPAMVDELLKNQTLSMVSERAHVQGLASLRGLHDTKDISVEALREERIERMRDTLGEVDPDVRREEIQQMLNVMEDARKRHAAADTMRDKSSFQNPATLGSFKDGLSAVQTRWAKTGTVDPKDFEKALNERNQKKVSKEVAALDGFRTLRMECRSAMERGQTLEAAQLQEEASRNFYQEVDAGRVSPELHQALRAGHMDPATLMEQVQGVSVEHHQKVLAQGQIEAIRTEVPAAAEGRGFLYRAPGRFHEEPIPMAAYNHGGQERLAFMQGGRIQDMALDEVRGNAHHPGHGLALRFEAMQKAVNAGYPEQQDWNMARAGFLRMDGPLNASTGPWRGAPGHVGVRRTEPVESTSV
jgi:hypothetical protein